MSKPASPLRWGIVGLGWVSADFTVPGILKSPGSRLVACLGSSPEKSKAFAERFPQVAQMRERSPAPQRRFRPLVKAKFLLEMDRGGAHDHPLIIRFRRLIDSCFAPAANVVFGIPHCNAAKRRPAMPAQHACAIAANAHLLHRDHVGPDYQARRVATG